MLSRIVRRLGREEQGVVLVIALMTMTVLGIVTGTAIYYTTSNQTQSDYSKASDAAYRLAEAGVNNASATLGLASNNAQDQATMPSTEATALSNTYPTGTAKWWGVFNATTNIWTVYGKGIVNNPIVGAGSVTRQLSASIAVTASLTQPLNAQAWNYWFATNQGGATACDVNISNNVEVDASFYVMGNLCLSNNAKIVEDLATPRLPIVVAIQGKFGYSNGTSIGRSGTNTATEVHINGGCGSTALTSTHTCKAYPTTGYDSIYATRFDTAGNLVTPPTVDWSYWYTHASPGPTHPCTTSSGTYPTWDNNTSQDITGTIPNGSVPTSFDLTPGFDYSCSASGGSISWVASTKTLTISGAMYIDGSATVSNGAVNEYNGMGTLYLSGSLYVNGMMCGKRNAGLTDCDFSNWNPNTEMFIVGVHGVDASNEGVLLNNSSKWEGGIYTNTKVVLSNNAVIEGPVVGGTFTFSNNVTLKPFPTITVVPLGAPGNPNVYAQPNPPSGYSG